MQRAARSLQLGKRGAKRLAATPAGEHGRGMVKEIKMTKPVRYRKGCLFQDHGAWFVRYREPVRQKDGSVKFRRQAKRPTWTRFRALMMLNLCVSASCKKSTTIIRTVIPV
jgi:hypothetical protein